MTFFFIPPVQGGGGSGGGGSAPTDPIPISQVTGLSASLASKAAITHNHDVTDLNITETPDGTKFLRDDGSWQPVPGGSGGHTIQDEGLNLIQRTNLNFQGAGISVVDNPGADTTEVVLTSPVLPITQADVTDLPTDLNGITSRISTLESLVPANTTLINTNRTDIDANTTAIAGKADTVHTHVAANVTDFDTQVRTSTLNQMAQPTADLPINNNKLTGVADPTLAQDAATKNYVDTTIVGGVTFIGGYNAATNTPDLDTTPIAGILTGHMYKVNTAGTFFSTPVNIGDFLISKVDAPTLEADWEIFVDPAVPTTALNDLSDVANTTPATGDILVNADGANYNNLAVGAAGTVLKSDGTSPSWQSASLLDDITHIQNAADITKEIRFDASAITTGNQRVASMPDSDITLAGINIENAWTAGVKQKFTPNATNAGINVGRGNTLPTTPESGDLIFSGTDGKVKVHELGQWRNLVDTDALTWKTAVLAVSDSNVTLSGEQTIDGITTNQSRVLLTGQTDPIENGIWITETGTWSRPLDFNLAVQPVSGAMVAVREGTTHNNKIFQCTTDGSPIIDTDPLAFAEFGGSTTTFGDINYLTLTNGTGVVTGIANGIDIIFNGTPFSSGTNITYNGANGEITIQPGTYEFDYNLRIDEHVNPGNGFIFTGFVDSTNTLFPESAVVGHFTGLYNGNQSLTGVNNMVLTVTSPTIVKVRVIAANTTASLTRDNSWLSVKQIVAGGSGGTPDDNSVTTAKIVDKAVDNTKLADMPTLTIKGNDTGTAGPPKDLTVAETVAMLNVASTTVANTFTAEQTIEDNNFIVSRDGISGEVGPNFIGRGMRGTIAAPTLPQNEDRLGTFVAQGWDGTAFRAGGRFSVDVDGTPAANSMPGKVEIHTTPTGSVATQRRMVIRQDGTIQCEGNPITNAAEAVNFADVPNLGQVGSFCQYRDGDITTNINIAHPGIKLPLWGTEEFLDAGFTKIDNTEIRCDFDGVVEVYCSLRATSTGADTAVALRAGINGVLQLGITDSMFIANTNGLNTSSTSINKFFAVSNGDLISFHAAREGNVTTAITMNNQTFAWIKRVR